ncbi:MAG: hypothetical protein COA57_02405 [Flavobacteriales bacterium]|nr:MAG: hypothetical protein COA57_02405 [Flavobacteriales bacterium]
MFLFIMIGRLVLSGKQDMNLYSADFQEAGRHYSFSIQRKQVDRKNCQLFGNSYLPSASFLAGTLQSQINY